MSEDKINIENILIEEEEDNGNDNVIQLIEDVNKENDIIYKLFFTKNDADILYFNNHIDGLRTYLMAKYKYKENSGLIKMIDTTIEKNCHKHKLCILFFCFYMESTVVNYFMKEEKFGSDSKFQEYMQMYFIPQWRNFLENSATSSISNLVANLCTQYFINVGINDVNQKKIQKNPDLVRRIQNYKKKILQKKDTQQ